MKSDTRSGTDSSQSPLAAHLRPLRELLYTYLRDRMASGDLKPGMFFNLKELSEATGVSATPLREALIQLELEGFVSILPRRGVVVRPLELEDVRNLYQLLGALEASALIEVFPKMTDKDLTRMETCNDDMETLLGEKRYIEYQEKNLAFHRVYVDLSDNRELRRRIEVLKQRLYDFPRIDDLCEEWELDDLKDHRIVSRLLREGNLNAAAWHMQHVLWSFEAKKDFTTRYYEAHRRKRE